MRSVLPVAWCIYGGRGREEENREGKMERKEGGEKRKELKEGVQGGR